MSVSPLYPISNFNSYISGKVTVEPNAAIATGVVLQAEPNSQIIIAGGVCIGMGVILHARDGILEVEAGATLGAGVLVVGKGKIGANACIGAATTLLNPAIVPHQVVASGSLIGDSSRLIETPNSTTPPTQTAVIAAPTQEQESISLSQETAVIAAPTQEQESVNSQPVVEAAKKSDSQIVYGKASLTQLMATLFPQRHQSLSQPLQDDSSQTDST